MAPSKSRISEIFSHLASGDADTFFSFVDPNVEWTVMSQSILGGTYNSTTDFREKTLARLGPLMDSSTPMRIKVHNIIGGGADEEWSTVEMNNESLAKSGMRYYQTYAWCLRWSKTDEKIVQVRAYLDTALVDRVIESNE